MRKLLPPHLYLLALLTTVAGHWASATDTAVLPLLLGTLLAIGGLAITVSQKQLFQSLQTNVDTFEAPDKLVQQGLYRHTRNPMYLGFALSLLGWAIAFPSVAGWLATAAFVLVSDRWYIPFEERAMQRRFGEPYSHYCATTPRWIGR